MPVPGSAAFRYGGTGGNEGKGGRFDKPVPKGPSILRPFGRLRAKGEAKGSPRKDHETSKNNHLSVFYDFKTSVRYP